MATVTSGGLLTAVGPTNGANYTVSANGPSGTVSGILAIKNPLAFVTGRVRNVNGTGVPSVNVLFYTTAGGFTAKTTSAPDGTFRANVPGNTTKFTIDIETADPGSNHVYHRQFEYTPPGHADSLSYQDGEESCLASLPDLTVGTTTPIGDVVLDDRASGPPPPPTGCVGG